MASNELKVTVDGTAAVHKALAKFAQDLYRQYGIQIRHVDIDWIHRAGVASDVVNTVQIDSQYEWIPRT